MKQYVLITGASRGIGEAIAKTFAKEGYCLYITCKESKDDLEKVAQEIRSLYHVEVQTFVGDIGNSQDIKLLFEQISTVDILINNAGVSYIGLLSEMDISDWNRIMNTNLTSAFLCSKYVIPGMVSNKQGKIINISSVWGIVGASMEVAYATSKAGLNGFTKALAKELAPSNIQVNAIACGLIDTNMNACYNEEELSCIIEGIPADRIGKPEEVAELALQLATGNHYLTGQVITLDGGWT